MRIFAILVLALLAPGLLQAGDKAKEDPAVIALVEDDNDELVKQLNNDGGLDGSQIQQEYREVFAGVASLKAGSFQRFSSRLKNWNFTIAENPQPGQYRYLRFAWKRTQGPGIMIQLHANPPSWNQRYFAGAASPQTMTWGAMIRVAQEPPRDWVLVTRDLFKDYGGMTMTGFAFTPMEGGGQGYFDHVYLGRTVKDLDQATNAAFGKTPLKEALTPKKLDELWANLGSSDVKVAGPALHVLLAGKKDSIPYFKTRLKPMGPAPDLQRLAALLIDLGDEDFGVREAAQAALNQIGPKAVPTLRQALVNTKSPEVRLRLQLLLGKHGSEEGNLTVDQLRLLRVIRILEWSESAQARPILEMLHQEVLEAGLNQEVKNALAKIN